MSECNRSPLYVNILSLNPEKYSQHQSLVAQSVSGTKAKTDVDIIAVHILG